MDDEFSVRRIKNGWTVYTGIETTFYKSRKDLLNALEVFLGEAE